MTASYLDYNATSVPRQAAIEAARLALEEGGNASSIHQAGRRARARLEEARAGIAAMGGDPGQGLIFTSGATEANALALNQPGISRILVSAVEHPAVLEAAPGAERLPVDANGIVVLPALEQALAREDARGTLVAVMAVNNETGVIQPIEEIAGLVTAAGARLHVDAVQAAGRIEIDLAMLGRATLSLSGHKIGGPPGIGALLYAEGLEIKPTLRGGGQERRMRAGTENLPGAVGFAAAAAELMHQGIEERLHISTLRDHLEKSLSDVAPDAVVLGATAPRVGNTSCIALPGVPAEKQVIALDLAGVQVSAGAACSSGKVAASHVLTAMGLPSEVASAAIRVSFGWASTEDDVAQFLDAYARLAAKVRAA